MKPFTEINFISTPLHLHFISHFCTTNASLEKCFQVWPRKENKIKFSLFCQSQEVNAIVQTTQKRSTRANECIYRAEQIQSCRETARQRGVITPPYITKCRFLLKKKLYGFISRDTDAVVTFSYYWSLFLQGLTDQEDFVRILPHCLWHHWYLHMWL